ncbi:MAG: heavy-metal-associated domain-containing protein [Acidobacteriota bacterium]
MSFPTGAPGRARASWTRGAAGPLVVAALMWPWPAEARIRQVSVPVRGMTCVLCTRALEEAIRSLGGVAEVSADLSSSSLTVGAAEGRSLSVDQVRARVRQAGFEVDGECQLVARGHFNVGPSRQITFKVSGTKIVYQVLEGHQFLQLIRAHPDLKGEFEIRCRLHDHRYWKPAGISITGFEALTAPARDAGR